MGSDFRRLGADPLYRVSDARRGYSRDKRTDCKQVCVGLVLTAEGFVKAHEVFSGNTADTSTEVGSTPPPRANTGKSTTGSPSPEPSFPNDTTTPPQDPSNRTLRSDSKNTMSPPMAYLSPTSAEVGLAWLVPEHGEKVACTTLMEQFCNTFVPKPPHKTLCNSLKGKPEFRFPL
ncbi:MAG: hypothetical protein IID61_10335 [SAR324 cluster bacterium]|nr:hypothetical protein [SAR324 cluster bacterium]